MRRVKTFSVLFLGGLFLAACGGGEQESADMADTGDMAATPTSELSCYATVTMAEAQERPSPLQRVELSVGGNDGLLCYGAPSARGRDIMAACGQLKSASEKKSRAELDRLAEEKQAALG